MPVVKFCDGHAVELPVVNYNNFLCPSLAEVLNGELSENVRLIVFMTVK
jgi:hypothetical protein